MSSTTPEHGPSRTLRRNVRDGGREWIALPSGHLATRDHQTALTVLEHEPGGNHLIRPHSVTLEVFGDGTKVRLSVQQLRDLVAELGPPQTADEFRAARRAEAQGRS